jgi:hypothetical protein
MLQVRVRVGMTDDDSARIRALFLEDPELGEPDGR